MSTRQEVEFEPLSDAQRERTAVDDYCEGIVPKPPDGVAKPCSRFQCCPVEALRRTGQGVAVAVLLTPLLAMLETYWVAARSSEEVPVVQAWLAAVGLLAVPGLVVGALVGVAAWWLHPRHVPSVSRLWVDLRQGDSDAQRRRAVVAVIGPALGVAATALTAQSALALLVFERGPASVGLLMAGAAASIFCVIGSLALLVGQSAAQFLGNWHPDPVRYVGIGVVVAALAMGALIAVGTTSGAGGDWALFGVFKRQELDLRVPTQVLAWCATAYLGGPLVARVPRLVSALSGLAVLACLWLTASSALDDSRVALGMERSGALGRVALGVARKVSDRDRDGFSGWFGGGDCDENNRAVGPGADDIPGNGVDEDCSGKDAFAVVLEQTPTVATTPEGWIAGKVPEDLRLILITVDTLRYDIGAMGYPRNTTPNIDKLAAKSTVFTHAYSLASYTGKSVGPMLIGKYPSETHRGWSHFNEFRGPDVMLAQRLQSAGVRTVSVQGHWYFFQKRFGLDRGFDVIDSSAAPKQPQLEGDRSSTSQGIADATLAQLALPGHARGKLFLWAHFTDPHSDYVPHEGFEFGKSARDLYDGEVAFVDHHVGRILDAVSSGPDNDRTVVIIASDHGEAFGEHGMWRHGFELWEPLVRVPWIVHMPGSDPRRIAERRSLIDLVPTILDLFRLPAQLADLSGKSVLIDVLGPPGHQVRPGIVFVDMSEGPHNAERQAFIEDDMKLVASSARPMGLYNLASDPSEAHDLLKNKAASEAIIERFKAFRRELKLVRVGPPR